MTLSGNVVLPQHPHERRQRRHQRGFARSGRLSAERGRPARARRRGLHRLSDERRQRRQHAVSVLALHRPGAVSATSPRRSATGSSTAPIPISTTTACAGQIIVTGSRERAQPPVHGRRRVRRQPRRLPAVHAAGLPESGPQRHRRGRVRRRRHRRRASTASRTTRASISTGTSTPGASTPRTR